MPNIQISQIILRSGEAIDLPGAPTSLSPLTFAPGLERGEMAFMTDTGRIYIGHDPKQGQPQFNRLSFPYRNIEVLTENSTDTIQRMVGDAMRDGSDDMFYAAALTTHETSWENVVVPRTGDENYVYRLPYSDSVSAVIDYCVYDPDLKPIKMGALTVRYFEGEAEPQLTDEASVMRRLDLLEPESSRAGNVFGLVDFQFIVAGPLNARYLAFQYKNHTNTMLSLRFRTSRPKA